MPRRRPARSTHPPLSTAHKVVPGNYYLLQIIIHVKIIRGPLISLCPLDTKLHNEMIIYIKIIYYISATHPPLSTPHKVVQGNYYLHRNYSLQGATHPPPSTQILRNQRPEIFATSSHHMTTFQIACSIHPPPSSTYFFLQVFFGIFSFVYHALLALSLALRRDVIK